MVVKKFDRNTVSEEEAKRMWSETKLVPSALPDLVPSNASDTTSGEIIIEARSLEVIEVLIETSSADRESRSVSELGRDFNLVAKQ